MKKKKNRNSQPQTKFTGSYKKSVSSEKQFQDQIKFALSAFGVSHFQRIDLLDADIFPRTEYETICALISEASI